MIPSKVGQRSSDAGAEENETDSSRQDKYRKKIACSTKLLPFMGADLVSRITGGETSATHQEQKHCGGEELAKRFAEVLEGN
jgi:hypothetical protein